MKKKAKAETKRLTRCTGHCCKDFVLPYSPAELKAKYLAWVRDGRAEIQMGSNKDAHDTTTPEDIHLIYPMVIHLGQYDMPARAYVNPPDASATRTYSEHKPPHHYTCKHYDAVSGNCEIYDIRPAMCRNCPYSSSCNYAACTWRERKAKKAPKKKPECKPELLKELASALKSDRLVKRKSLPVIQPAEEG